MLIHWYRFANWLSRHKIPFLPGLLCRISNFFYNSYLPPTAKIGRGTVMAYGGIGVVIHDRAVIGENCVLGQNITIGGKSGWYEVPIIGDNVHVSAGARILGPVRVGNNVIIGANAVVVKDVPDNCIVAGVPAKIIRDNLTLAEFDEYKILKYRGNHTWPVTPK